MMFPPTDALVLLYVLRPDLRGRVRGVRPGRRARPAALVRAGARRRPRRATSSRSAGTPGPVPRSRAGSRRRRGSPRRRSTRPPRAVRRRSTSATRSARSAESHRRVLRAARGLAGPVRGPECRGNSRRPSRRWRPIRSRSGCSVRSSSTSTEFRRPHPSSGASASGCCSDSSCCAARSAGPRPPGCSGPTSTTRRRWRTCA